MGEVFCRNTKERMRLHKRSLSEPQEAASAMQVVGGVEMVQGVTQLTRAIGFGTGKQHKGGQAASGLSPGHVELPRRRLGLPQCNQGLSRQS